MKGRTRGIVLGAALLLVVLGIAWVVRARSGASPVGVDGQGSRTATGVGAKLTGPAVGNAPGGKPVSPGGGAASAPAGAIAEMGWGSGPSQLGHERPQEGNPEGPMSFATDASGNTVVLDQVNQRLLRLDKDGKVVSSLPLTQQTPQDVVIAKDGTVVVLDRLRDKSVALLDPQTGKQLGELPLPGKNIPEPGLVTGTFVDGKSVYVEREHGALVRIGDTDGLADPERPEIPGRPTRDGRAYLLAGIVDRASGRVYVNAIDRQTGEHRYTREYRLQLPVLSIVLLDTDLAGTIYLGVMVEAPTGSAAPATQPQVKLLCIEPAEGKPLGQADLPANTLPEESFRDYVVLDQGGVVYQLRTESGVLLQRASCK